MKEVSKALQSCLARCYSRLKLLLLAVGNWLGDRTDIYLLGFWLSLGVQAGYHRLATSWCRERTSSVLPHDSPLMLSYPCTSSALKRFMHMLRNPVQVYRDLLWDSPRPIRWVQGQMFAVMIRFAAVVLLPPATYRVASPWLSAVARAVAPACLVAISWGPAIRRLHTSADIACDTDAVFQRTVSSPALGDEYNEFSLRWYPLMDVAFNFVHPTSMLVEVVYALFSATCILAIGLPHLPGLTPPRGFMLPQQLARCALSSSALLAVEIWRKIYLQRRNSCTCTTSGATGSGSTCGNVSQSSAVAVEAREAKSPAAVMEAGGSGGHLPRLGIAGVESWEGSPGGPLRSSEAKSEAGCSRPRGLVSQLVLQRQQPEGCSGTGGAVGQQWKIEGEVTRKAGAVLGRPCLPSPRLLCAETCQVPGPIPATNHGDGGKEGNRDSSVFDSRDVLTARHVLAPEHWQQQQQLCLQDLRVWMRAAAVAAYSDHHDQQKTAAPCGLQACSCMGETKSKDITSPGHDAAGRRCQDWNLGPVTVLSSPSQRAQNVAEGKTSGSLTPPSSSAGEKTAPDSDLEAIPQLQPPQPPQPPQPQQPQQLPHVIHLQARYLPLRLHHHPLQQAPGLSYPSCRQTAPPPSGATARTRPSGAAPSPPKDVLAVFGEVDLPRLDPGTAMEQEQQQRVGGKSQEYMPYIGRTVRYRTRIKVDGFEPEHIPPGYPWRLARVADSAGLLLEGVWVRRGCIELIIETRAVGGNDATSTGLNSTTLGQGTGQQLVGSSGGSRSMVVHSPLSPSGGGEVAATATAVTAAGECNECGGRTGDLDESLGPNTPWDHLYGSSDRFDSGVSFPVPLRAAAVEPPGESHPHVSQLSEDVVDIGAIIRALKLPESCSLESDLTIASDSENEYDGFISGAARAVHIGRECSRGGGGGHPGDGSGGHSPLQLPILTMARDGAVAWQFTPGGGGSGGEASSGLSCTLEESQVTLGERSNVWWDSAGSSARAAAQPRAADGPRRQLDNTGGGQLRDAVAEAAWRQAHNGGVPTVSRILPPCHSRLTHILEVYPRVLYVGPARRGNSSGVKQEGGGTRDAATALPSASTPATLVMVVSWLASEGAAEALDGRPEVAEKLAMPAEVVRADPWVSAAVSAPPCSSSRDLDPPRGTPGSGTAVSVIPPSLASAATTGCGAATSSADTSNAGTAGSASSAAPTAQIFLRYQGEVVVVAAVTLATALTMDGGSGLGTTSSMQLPPHLHQTSQPWAGTTVSASSFSAASTTCWSQAGETGEERARPVTQPTAGASPALPTSTSPRVNFAGGSSAHHQQLLPPPREKETGSSGFGGLWRDALYLVEVEGVVRQLQPGVLRVEVEGLGEGEISMHAPQGPAAVAGVRHPSLSPVPVLLVDDPGVEEELQTVLKTWYGTVDELDSFIYDLGALLRLQDELLACAAAAVSAGQNGSSSIDKECGTGRSSLQLSSLSARTQMLHRHVVLYVEAMTWSATRTWLQERQQATAAAVSAAMDMVTPRSLPPALQSAAAGDDVVAAAATAFKAPAAGGAPSVHVAASGVVLLEAETRGPAQATEDPAARSPNSGDSRSHSSKAWDCNSASFSTAGKFGRRAASTAVQRPWLRRVRQLLHLLLVTLDWRRESDTDAGVFSTYRSQFTANLMTVMQALDLIGFLIVMTRSSDSANGLKALVDPDKACVGVAASTGLLIAALWLLLPGPTWRRVAAYAKWPRQVSYTMSKVLVACLGLPQPPATLRHELGPGIFLVEGIVVPASVLMNPLEAVVVGLIRAPLCARMWLRAMESDAGISAAGGHRLSEAAIWRRALALAALSVLTTIAVHLYIRVSYERRRRSGHDSVLTKPAKSD